MTTPKPAPQEENLQQAPATETPRTTGFFNRVQQELNPPKPIHPSEAAEIVIMDDGEGDGKLDK